MTLISCIFFKDTATTEIYTLSLHDALPISPAQHREQQVRADRRRGQPAERARHRQHGVGVVAEPEQDPDLAREDRKSTRLNSSHANISYAVLCLKKKRRKEQTRTRLDSSHA